MKKSLINVLILSVSLATSACSNTYGSRSQKNEDVTTDAGHIDFGIFDQIKNAAAYQHIHHLDEENGVVEFKDGSRWRVSRLDGIKGWEKSKHLVITQNHATFSTDSYALVNLDIKLAEPISLIREPTPTKDVQYVKNIIFVNDILTLSNGLKWVIHSSDRGKLSKMVENDRIVIGVNSEGDKDQNPYLLIDTSTNNCVRAQQLN
jgi:hypothetical protein